MLLTRGASSNPEGIRTRRALACYPEDTDNIRDEVMAERTEAVISVKSAQTNELINVPRYMQ